MRIDFTGRGIEVTPDLRRYTQQRLRKLTRLFGDRCEVKVILTAQKRRRTAEITLRFRDRTLVGIQETPDPRSSISGAMDKLERQAVRFFARKRARKRRPRPAAAVLLNVLGGSGVDHEERLVLETERRPIKPLPLEEAIEQVNSNRSEVVVFRNTQTERVNVIYRRSDGNIALIEPEP